MLVTFLIMLREGIEAALIVGIVAGFLKQSGYSHMIAKVWLGVVLAALMCLGIGWIVFQQTNEIPHQQQGLIAGIIGLFAVSILTYMILWMKKAARSMKQHLQDSVSLALKRGNGHGWALVGMAFLAVAREGIETVFILLSLFQQNRSGYMVLGAVLGLSVAIVIGWLIYEGGVRLNLARFFRWTGVFLILVAAGLFAGAFRGLHTAGLWNLWQTTLFDWSGFLSEKSAFGAILSGFLGYKDHPTLSDFILYFAYLLPVLYLFLRDERRPPAAVQVAE